MKKFISKYFPKNNIFSLISIFFFTFGLTLVIAIFYTDSEKGIIVNLICSIFFILSGVGSVFISRNNSEDKINK
ncbi:MAG: hypothetical protein KKF62_06120 [Bacteroidetes bacterium]|nr:hypothetical protein [Bacteroidota bacterium]MBU1113592.1 hypothetical protein [Bacteroidota bacterium]MBU1796968.1 hypothetical protein [Bacteroidota bacterium]